MEKLFLFLKKNLIWILLFGSLIGLNETFIASFDLPSHSIILSAITLALFAFARKKMPIKGSSFLVLIIALLFKINHEGMPGCTNNAFLCGPLALILLGTGFELFSSLLAKRDKNFLISISLTALFAFGIFGGIHRFSLGVWETSKFLTYTFLKAPLAIIFAGVLFFFGKLIVSYSKKIELFKTKLVFQNGLLGIVIVVLWLFGTFAEF